jgi:hypothetical protein
MNIRDYFCDANYTSEGFQPIEEWKEVAALARGCAREGEDTLCIMEDEPGCCACGSTAELCPYRVRLGRTLVVGLFCARCNEKLNLNAQTHGTIRGRVLRALRDNIDEDISFDMAYLFQFGPRIRMVRGRNLHSEVLT